MQTLHSRDRRRGNAVVVVVALLLLVALALGGNYVRNLKVDQETEKKSRPYAKYGLEDLRVLAEGYRAEVAAAEKRHGGGRVKTQQRHHFDDQVREFERVQKKARKARDKALEIAQLRRDLQRVEAEIQLRGGSAGDFGVHLERMFRF